MERYVTQVGVGTPEEGRKEIPLEVALNVQMRMLDLMTPEAVRPYVTDREDDPVRSALLERFMEKYMLGFNGFTEYCNEHRAESEFMDRARRGDFNTTDYSDMIKSFETNEHGEPFFRSQAEVDEFLKPFVH